MEPIHKPNTGRRDGDKPESPFARSSRVKRTPPVTPTTPMAGVESERSSRENTASRGGIEQLEKLKMMGDAEIFQYCRDVIQSMRAAAERQKNMAMEVKAGLPKLEEALDMLEFQHTPQKIRGLNRATQTEGAPTQHTANPTRGHNRATQTEVALVPQRVNSSVVNRPSQARSAERNSGNKRAASSPAEQRMQGKKKREESTAEEGKSRRKARKANRAKKEGEDAGATPTTVGRGKQASTRKKAQKVRTREEAVLIKPGEGKTYAQVLSVIREGTNPETTGRI